MTLRTYRNLPAIVTGYPLDDVWSVVVPIARTNEVTNPSFETATTGYTAGAGSLARSTTQQYHGAYSGAYTPSAATTDGFFYGTISTTSGQTRAISCKFRGIAGVPYALTFATTGGVDLVIKPFVSTGRWQWVILYYTETSTTTRRIYFRKNGSTNVGIYYVDGVQSETITAGELASTYIDGDQLGLVPNQSPVAYYWSGTPHASTSTRSGLTRAGGMVIPFKKYGFILTAMIGLGLAAPQNVATDYARIDGSYDDYTRKPTRQYTLTGRFQGRTYGELRKNRSGLGQYFDRDLIGQDQRLTLLRNVEDGYGRVVSSTIRSYAKYESGFGGSTDNMHAETVPLTFTQNLPAILADGESGGTFTVQSSVSNANGVLQRSPAGVWSAMGTGIAVAETVEVMAVGRDGLIYAGGSFATMGGVANASKIAAWNPATQAWTAMGTGGTAGATAAFAIAVAPNGNVVVGGTFTGMGGVANTSQLALWNGSAWSSLTPLGVPNNSVTALAYDSLGNLYAAGSFTTINGVAAAQIAKYDGATWTALTTGLTGGAANVLLIDAGNNIYVGGSFTLAGGVANTPGIAKWNGTAWSALGVGLTGGAVRALAFDSALRLYAGGQFTASGSVTLTKLGLWNGSSWTPLGTGTSGGTNAVTELTFNNIQNILYVGGVFTAANGITLPDALALWTGGGFVFADVDLPGTATANAIIFGRDGTQYIGYDTRGSATAGSVTAITNPGTADSFPTIKITGPTSGAAARMWSIINTTTNRSIFFNYLMNVGETATLTFTPDNLSFISNVQGDIKIQAGSNTADFFLQPGANNLAFLSADATMTAYIYYRPAYASIDDVP